MTIMYTDQQPHDQFRQALREIVLLMIHVFIVLFGFSRFEFADVCDGYHIPYTLL